MAGRFDYDNGDPVSGKKHRIKSEKSAQSLADQLGRINAQRRLRLIRGDYVGSMRGTSVTNAGANRLAHRVGSGAANRMINASTGSAMQRRQPAGRPNGGQFAPKG